ncbi:hypothetical protein KIW84_072908 [Lathyrus oleraceus]|uniref:HECT domain-containing protein n=1 Tax=Pisum sativum TaxID=3888 RepID=A0A9D4VNI3_PEA|nr:hypothetical protein KIW84_072908 [Pisum sativum]
MSPPCPPFECAHMWGPPFVSSLKDSSLHSSLRQPAFDLIQTIIVSDVTALIYSVLNCRVTRSIDSSMAYEFLKLDDESDDILLSSILDGEEQDCNSSWSEFNVQSGIASQECRDWMCIPMLWVDVLVDISPSILPLSFSKAVFFGARSRFPMVELESSAETMLPVRSCLSSVAAEISSSFGWKQWSFTRDYFNGKTVASIVLLAAVVFCLLSAWCSDKLGLSLELGSFMAGVMISTIDFAQHTLDQVEPIRNLYIACICYFGGGYTSIVENLHYREAPIADLCLDFTLPGYPDYTLKPRDEIVDLNNLEDYISMVVDATAKTGITRQLEAFRAEFNQAFDVSSLQIFTPHELDYLLCGRRELWKTETLADHIKFDHGYTAKSPAIVNLLEIMGGFTPEQQRAFCQFVTGAPKLPLGGLAVLNPKLTIVRKLSSTAVNTSYNGIVHSESADDDLPSVKACALLEPNNSLDQSL